MGGAAAGLFAGLFSGLARGFASRRERGQRRAERAEERDFVTKFREEQSQLRATERAEGQSLREFEQEQQRDFSREMARMGHRLRTKEQTAKTTAEKASFQDLLRSPRLRGTIMENPEEAALAARGDSAAFKSLLKKAPGVEQQRTTAGSIAAKPFEPIMQAEIPPIPPPLPEYGEFHPTPSMTEAEFMSQLVEKPRGGMRSVLAGVFQTGTQPSALSLPGVTSRHGAKRAYKIEMEVERSKAYDRLVAARAGRMKQIEGITAAKAAVPAQHEKLSGEVYRRLKAGEKPEDIAKGIRTGALERGQPATTPSYSEAVSKLDAELRKLNPTLLESLAEDPDYVRDLSQRFGLDAEDVTELMRTFAEEE